MERGIMKLLFKFKDGLIVEQELKSSSEVLGEGDFLRLILESKEQNRDISIEAENLNLQRKYQDLYSVEIVLVD
jgi:hypothetical protein